MRVKHLIEKYIENDITSEELRELLHYLDQPEWQEYFNQSLETEKIIRDGFESLLRKKIKEEYEKYETDIPFEQIEEDVLKYGSKAEKEEKLPELPSNHNNKCKCKPLYIALSIAATVLISVLIILCLYSYKNIFKTSGDHLYKDYHNKFNLYVTRAPKDISKISYYEAVNLYVSNQYKESLNLSRQLLQKDSSNMDYRFLYALTLIESGNTNQAKKIYIPLIRESLDVKNDMIYAVSTWHVSLIYLKEEKPDSSLLYLNTLRPEDNLFVDLEKTEELKQKLLKIKNNKI